MITLILVRHAESAPGSPTGDDHGRPLTRRGSRDARAMAERLSTSGVTVDRIVASTAVRARTTAAAFGSAFGVEPELRDDLYGAGARRLREAATTEAAGALLIVAHDPGMTVLVDELSGGGVAQMPPCGVAVFTWATDDADVASATDPDDWRFDSPRS